jgi:hypothetical protein
VVAVRNINAQNISLSDFSSVSEGIEGLKKKAQKIS